MFIMFSPYSFLFFSTYILFMFSLLSISSFYYYWAVMELMMLLFMGLSYTLFVSSYSQLMVYFLIQAISSFFILIFYIYDLSLLLTVAFLMKLSMFPFFMWYINLIYRFPNFIFWLASTLHKVPAMVMISVFSLRLDSNLLWLSIILTYSNSGVMMLTVLDFRMVLVLSSIGNNSWFLLSQMTNMFVFMFFVFVYSFSLYYILSSFKGLSKPLYTSSLQPSSYFSSFWVLSLSGMPPFPLFYGKMLVIVSLLYTLGFNYMFFIFLIFNSLMVMGYLQSIMKYFIYVYNTSVHYLLKY
uniref:NADH dehydrogenase subunit 2 n=1 Tax=Brachionus rubens TaxID=392764 RepID=A0A0C4L1W5_9BILA|nr:NADH dehydrogenase subunit 2 [Brachionus rubens]